MLWCRSSLSGYYPSVPSTWLHFKHRQHSNFQQNIYESDSITSHIPGFFLLGGWLHALAPRWALGRTKPETVQPGAWKLHVGPEPAQQYLLSASHIHSAKRIQELQSGTKPSFIQSCRLDTMWVWCVNLSAAPVTLSGDRKRCCKTSLRLGAVRRVCELSGAGMREGVTTPQTSTHHSYLSPPSSPWGDTPCLHAWRPPNVVQTRMFDIF